MGDTAEEHAAQQRSRDSVEVSDAEDPQENRESGQSLVTPLDSKFAVGDSTIRSLARQLKELHHSLGCDVILKARQLRPDGASDETTFPCSSLVVATWSPSFRSLLKENTNDKDAKGCRTIELKGNLKVVEDAIAFMKEGRRSFSVVDLKEQHPLLEFASEYGLDDLKVTYGEAMMCQNPVTLQNASLYLELGLRFSIVNLSLVAADLLAANVGRPLSEAVLALDGCCFKAVLASDALNVEDEQDVLSIIKSWVEKDTGERSSDLDSFLSQVRLSLCSYQTLIDLMSNLGADSRDDHGVLWKGVDEEHLRLRVRRVIDEKLQGGRLSDRQRHHTKLPRGEDEERLATTLKVSKDLFAACASTTVLGSPHRS